MYKTFSKIAIIGAGLAGLNLARLLGELADVIVFEKSNKLGGRLSTLNVQGFSFDHGAQFFTAKNPAFQTFVKELEAHHAAEQWNARFVELKFGEIQSERTWDKDFPHYVGSPAMNSIAQYLARNIDIRFNQMITVIKKIKSNFIIRENNYAEYESLIFEDEFVSNTDGFFVFANDRNASNGLLAQRLWGPGRRPGCPLRSLGHVLRGCDGEFVDGGDGHGRLGPILSPFLCGYLDD